ncbi:MAG: hypothetical protein SVU69_00675 [Pseudomonadota bacterium]|nr:hypothetical protein [Pseudomonadota bacterium]
MVKILKGTLLAGVLLVAPFAAQAELEPMSDMELQAVTGEGVVLDILIDLSDFIDIDVNGVGLGSYIVDNLEIGDKVGTLSDIVSFKSKALGFISWYLNEISTPSMP